MHQHSGVNKVLLFGEVTDDKIITEPSADGSYLLLIIATAEVIKRGNGIVEHKEFHKIKVPQKLLTQEHITLAPGQHVYLEGKLQTTSFTDRDNVRRYNLEVIVSRIELMA